MISLLVQEQVIAEHRKMLIRSITPNKMPKAIHSHINQSESLGPKPTPEQYTALAENFKKN